MQVTASRRWKGEERRSPASKVLEKVGGGRDKVGVSDGRRRGDTTIIVNVKFEVVNNF